MVIEGETSSPSDLSIKPNYNKKFKTLTEPYEGFHDMNFVDEYGPAAYINRARKEGARDFGACMSPHTAFLVLQGIETLNLRMERHIQNTRSIVDFLNSHQSVKSVCYPELENHPDYNRRFSF